VTLLAAGDGDGRVWPGPGWGLGLKQRTATSPRIEVTVRKQWARLQGAKGILWRVKCRPCSESEQR